MQSADVTVWGVADEHVIVRMPRDRLKAASGLVRSVLDEDPAAAINLTGCLDVKIRREHLDMLTASMPPVHRRRHLHLHTPECCTVRQMQEMVAVCSYLDVPASVRSNVGAHMSSAARIPLLRIQVFEVGALKHQADLMLTQPDDDGDGEQMHNLLRYRGDAPSIWTLDPLMGRNEVHGSTVHELRIAVYHALRDILDIALSLGAHQLFDMVSEWAAHNAWMFTDTWVGDWNAEDEPPDVNLDEIAPTVIAEPEHLAALLRFSVSLKDGALQACGIYNSSEYESMQVYPDTDMASVCYMDPAVAACDGTDTAAPKWVIRFAVREPSSEPSSEPGPDEGPEEGPDEEYEEESDEESEEYEEYDEDEYEDSPSITGCDTLPPAYKQRRR
jgi:hypothetical protein